MTTLTTTISEQVEQFAEAAALDFSDAFEVPVEHPEDQGLREDFAQLLTQKVEQAITATQGEFADRARRLSEWRDS